MSATLKAETVIRRAIIKALRFLRVALPGIVQSYDPEKCECSVQISILDRDRDELANRILRRIPVVNHVPVYFMQGGTSRLTMPVQRGDSCLLVFASSSLDRWKALGGEVDPNDDRHHHESDAIAFVGVWDFKNVKPAHATATVLESPDLRLGDDTGGLLALKADIDATNAKLNSLINKHNMHTHPASAGTTTATVDGLESTIAPATGTVKTRAK